MKRIRWRALAWWLLGAIAALALDSLFAPCGSLVAEEPGWGARCDFCRGGYPCRSTACCCYGICNCWACCITCDCYWFDEGKWIPMECPEA